MRRDRQANQRLIYLSEKKLRKASYGELSEHLKNLKEAHQAYVAKFFDWSISYEEFKDMLRIHGEIMDVYDKMIKIVDQTRRDEIRLRDEFIAIQGLPLQFIRFMQQEQEQRRHEGGE